MQKSPNPFPKPDRPRTKAKPKKPRLRHKELSISKKSKCKRKDDLAKKIERNSKEISKLRSQIRSREGDHRLKDKVANITKEINEIKKLRTPNYKLIIRNFYGDSLGYRIEGNDKIPNEFRNSYVIIVQIRIWFEFEIEK